MPFVSLRLINTRPTREQLRLMAARTSVDWCGHPPYAHWVCRSMCDMDVEAVVRCPARESDTYIDKAAFALDEQLPVCGV